MVKKVIFPFDGTLIAFFRLGLGLESFCLCSTSVEFFERARNFFLVSSLLTAFKALCIFHSDIFLYYFKKKAKKVRNGRWPDVFPCCYQVLCHKATAVLNHYLQITNEMLIP